jgi:hypothetical protein
MDGDDDDEIEENRRPFLLPEMRDDAARGSWRRALWRW